MKFMNYKYANKFDKQNDDSLTTKMSLAQIALQMNFPNFL